MSAEHELVEARCALTEACKLLELARCPNTGCLDGGIPVQIAEDEWEQEQCQWCYEKSQLVAEHG